MTTFEQTGKIHIAHAGDVVLISEERRPVSRLAGTQVILVNLSEEGRQALVDFLAANEIAEIQKALGIGRGTAGRIKRALGLSATYSKDSAATRYRRQKREHPV